MPTLLLYFPSKDELFREVVRSTVIAAVRSVEGDTVATGSTTADAVRAIAHRYWSTMGQSEMIAIARLALSELPRFPELATLHAIEGLERFVCLLERVIEAGVARGEVKPTDVRASARIIQATLAVHALWFAHPEIYGAITGADREKAATATIDTLLRTLIG
jgi:TetR/AcrR family transcriptional regulator